MATIEKVCRNCEYWDGGGEIAAKTATIGDCLNRLAPRFQTEPEFSCPQFFAVSSSPPRWGSFPEYDND